MRRAALAVGAAALAATTLAGCSSDDTTGNGATGNAATSSANATGTARTGTGTGTSTPKLSVSGAYVPRPPLADMAAGYFTVRNTGSGADELTSVTTSFASDASLMVTSANASMTTVGHLVIPAHGSLRLSEGGDHLMLMGLKGGRPEVGLKVLFVLHFAHSAPISVRVPVEPATYQPKD